MSLTAAHGTETIKIRARLPMRQIIASSVAAVSTTLAALVIFGWWQGIDVITRMCMGCVTMKLSTAISLFFQGLTTMAIIALWRTDRGKGIVLALGIGTVWSIYMGMLGSLPTPGDDGVHSIAPGIPSVGTALLLTCLAGIDFLFVSGRSWIRWSNVLSWICALISLVALIGYWLGIPLLYWEIEGFSGAMAVHTSIVLALLSSAHLIAHGGLKKHHRAYME